ncbi:MAG: MG2 domain-containing protein [Saprospiraceae bacterium]
MRTSIFILFLVCLLACKKNKDVSIAGNLDEENELLSQYFSAATSGIISVETPFHYILKEPLTKEVGEKELQNLIQLKPTVKGKVSLSNATILTFVPEQALASNTVYAVSLNLSALDKTKYSQSITYNIKTLEQQVKLDLSGFILQDNGEIDVLVNTKTADVANVQKLESCFSTQSTKQSTKEVNENRYITTLTYSNISKAKETIKFDGSPIEAKYSENLSPFDIPSNEFIIVHSHHDKENKELNLYFSKILNNQQDLTGLISLAGATPAFSIYQNQLKIFIDQNTTQEFLECVIQQGLLSKDGMTLMENFQLSIQNRINSPHIDFVSSGNYFPSEGEFKIPIKSRNLEKANIVVIEIKQENVKHYLAWHSMEYTDYYSLRMYGKPIFNEIISLQDGLVDEDGWTVYGLDLSQRIKKNPGSIYHVSLDYLPKYTTLDCKEALEKYQINLATPRDEYFYSKNADYREEYFYYQDYNWEKNSDPCHISFYAYKEAAKKLLICSDYSIIVKKAGEDYHIALSKIVDLSPVQGAEISMYDIQGEKITNSKSSSEGFAVINAPNQNGAILQIEKNGQTTYLSLDEADGNPLTEFDISGEMSESETEVFIYAERDIWRPGDSIYLNVLLNKKTSKYPKGLPIVCSFVNPDNVQLMELVKNINLDQRQIYTFVLVTSPGAKTGRYRSIIKIGNQTLRHTIQVETIKPNTVETILDVENLENNVVYSTHLAGNIKSQYLTGFAAPKTKINAVAKVYIPSTPFPDYGKYLFMVPGTKPSGNIEVFNTVTDEAGQTDFTCDYDFSSTNSPANVQIEIESILEGGGSNKEGKAIKISPFESYIGADRKVGSGWGGNHTFKENILINLIRLDKKGKLFNATHSVNYTIYKHTEHWWVDKYRLQHWGQFQSDDYWAFVRSEQTNLGGKGVVQIKQGSLLKGAYKVVFEDELSGHKTAVFFTVYDGVESIPGKEAHLLELVTEKDDYNAGDDVSLLIPDIPGAKALISIEKGKEVIQQFWYQIKDKNNEVIIPTNEAWAPNAYIHVTIIQPYKKLDNDLPLRMYGVKSIKLSGKVKPLTPVADIVASLESDKTYSFSVSEAQGRPMEYTISWVEEGLLSLKGFKTPDPHRHFNGKFPLLVKTWDIYKYFMAFFNGQFAGIISIGGDDAYKADALQEINRFKPVVIHQGSFKLVAKGKNKHTVTVPTYIGKLRLMIVACNTETFGSMEKMVTIKNSLMVQTVFPRSLQVTDKITLPIQVFRDDQSISTATLTAKQSNSLMKGLPNQKTISFGNSIMKKEMAIVEVFNKPGQTQVEMTVSGNGKKMIEKTNIVVQYPNPYSSHEKKHVLNPGQSVTVETKVLGYPDVFKGSLHISGSKSPDFISYAEKLVEFPYGCLEQVTSTGFGQLYLDKLLDLDPASNKKRIDHLNQVVHKISKQQKSNGQFNYWDSDYYHGWSDMYAGNFLLEMKNLGYLPPDNGVFQRWLNGQYQKANQWSFTAPNHNYYYENESLTHAYRLYILAKANKPAKSAMNRFFTASKSENPLVWWLLAGSFSQAGFDSKAKELITKAENLQKKPNKSYDYLSFGSRPRDLALIVEVLSGMGDQKAKMETYFDAMVEAYNTSSWTSTQDKGFACIATYVYHGKNITLNKEVEYAVTGLKNNQNYKHRSNLVKNIVIDLASLNKKVTIKNTGKSTIYLTQYARFIDDNIMVAAEQKELKMNVEYYNITQKRSGLDNLKLGDDVRIIAKVTNPSALMLRDMALNVVMPSCFELVNPRLYQTDQVTNQSSFIYQDYKDDRVYTFFELPAGTSKTYEWRAKAAFTGDFYFPAIQCENMYKGNLKARTATSRIVVGD